MQPGAPALVQARLELELYQAVARRPWQVARSARHPMRRFAMKALFTALTLSQAERDRIKWDRFILVVSTAVTIGLIMLYAYGKVTLRW